MARCDEGYRCDVCGEEVEALTDSDLYLRYVLGEVPPLTLPHEPERHIRCHAALAQYIVDAAFAPVVCTDIFAKTGLDAEFVRQEEERVTRGWRRLQEVARAGLPIAEHPLPEVIARWTRE